MHGRVIGIHSRIGNPITANMHVPSDAFVADWDKLLKGDSWAAAAGAVKLPTAHLGVRAYPAADFDGKGVKILEVVAGSPADKAGLKVDDIIASLNTKRSASSRTSRPRSTNASPAMRSPSKSGAERKRSRSKPSWKKSPQRTGRIKSHRLEACATNHVGQASSLTVPCAHSH